MIEQRNTPMKNAVTFVRENRQYLKKLRSADIKFKPAQKVLDLRFTGLEFPRFHDTKSPTDKLFPVLNPDSSMSKRITLEEGQVQELQDNSSWNG